MIQITRIHHSQEKNFKHQEFRISHPERVYLLISRGFYSFFTSLSDSFFQLMLVMLVIHSSLSPAPFLFSSHLFYFATPNLSLSPHSVFFFLFCFFCLFAYFSLNV